MPSHRTVRRVAARARTPALGRLALRDWLLTARIVPWLLPLGLLLVWETGARIAVIPENVLPATSALVLAGWRLILNGELPANIAVSFCRAVSGLIVGSSIAFLLGLANGLSKLSERISDTMIQMVRNIPNLALIPLVIPWFSIEEEARLFLTALGVFFPIFIETFHGVRTVDAQLVEMGRSYGMGRFGLFRRIFGRTIGHGRNRKGLVQSREVPSDPSPIAGSWPYAMPNADIPDV